MIKNGTIKIDQFTKSDLLMMMIDPCTVARAAANDPKFHSHIPFQKMCHIQDPLRPNG